MALNKMVLFDIWPDQGGKDPAILKVLETVSKKSVTGPAAEARSWHGHARYMNVEDLKKLAQQFRHVAEYYELLAARTTAARYEFLFQGDTSMADAEVEKIWSTSGRAPLAPESIKAGEVDHARFYPW